MVEEGHSTYLEIDSSELNNLFIFNNEECAGVNKEKYQNTICRLFGKKFNKTVNVRGTYVGKKISIRLYCAVKQCTKIFNVTIRKDEIQLNRNVKIEVTCNGNICNHNVNVVRNLMKDERAKVAQELKSASISTVRNETILNADKNMLSNGNLQNIHSQEVLRKTKSEVNSKNDMSSNPLFDLFLKIKTIKSACNVEYLEDKFSITLLSSHQIETFKNYVLANNKSKNINRLYYDATGKVCASPTAEIRSIFHHVLIIPKKASVTDKHCCLVNVGELITSLHTSDNQEIFLRRFFQLASKALKNDGMKRLN